MVTVKIIDGAQAQTIYFPSGTSVEDILKALDVIGGRPRRD